MKPGRPQVVLGYFSGWLARKYACPVPGAAARPRALDRQATSCLV